MKASTIVTVCVLALAAAPLALHLVGGTKSPMMDWVKALHGGGRSTHADASVAGRWRVTVEDPEGGVATMNLTQEARKITGTFADSRSDDLAVVGEIANGRVTFDVNTPAGHGERHLVFAGVIGDDGSIAGTVTGAKGASKWRAIRAKD